MSVTVQPYEPTILTLSPTSLPALQLSAPDRVPVGGDARISISPATSTPATTHIVHLDVLDPAGNRVDYYSCNLLAAEARASKVIPIATTDKTGRWQLHIRDVLSGSEQSASFEVY